MTSTARSRGAFASAVSRKIREFGARPLPSGSPVGALGIRVTTTWRDREAVVDVGYASRARSRSVAADLMTLLGEAGYEVEVNPHDAAMFTVTRKDT